MKKKINWDNNTKNIIRTGESWCRERAERASRGQSESWYWSQTGSHEDFRWLSCASKICKNTHKAPPNLTRAPPKRSRAPPSRRNALRGKCGMLKGSREGENIVADGVRQAKSVCGRSEYGIWLREGSASAGCARTV